jgi:hypothetical protein
MTTPVTAASGPCGPWDPIFCTTFQLGTSPVLTGSALMAATEILYMLSGQQFDLCQFTVRPCRDDCGQSWLSGGNWWEWGGVGFGGWPTPLLYNGNWYNLTCGNCIGSCSCTAIERTILPSPVANIVSVKLNGQTMPASAYRVDNFRELLRIDGGSWPLCQDMNAPDTANNTWSVTLTVGQPPPVAGQWAVGELTIDIVNACTGAECKTPRRATQITRQGVTVDYGQLTDLLMHGMTGLSWCDTFIAAYNPHRLDAPPMVYDVDRQLYRRAGTA